ncbi:MAG: monovalent cation/H(+) antiporter subunit G [Dichotomicrobium sp.]
MIDYLAGLLLIIGSFFTFVAAVGVVRLPDLYTRMHAASKTGTVGSGVMLLAIALHSGEFDVVTRAIAGIVFFLLTAPLSAHLLARAAYCTGVRPWPGTHPDELAGHYEGSPADTRLSSASN